MKFQVMGANRDTGARMTLEFEADSKAAAERKAAQQGMEVRSVREMAGPVPVEAESPRKGGSSFGMVRLALILIVLLAVAFVFRAPLLQLIGK